MALAAPPANDRKRVKVYELKSNDWFDRGTGFCVGSIVNDEARICVQSEDEPDRTLLETKISKDDGYQKQQDTLIVWTEQNGTDMALSFQEPEGCGAIWDFVSDVQQRLGAAGPGGPDDGISDDAIDNLNPIMLPPPELGLLPDIENMMRAANSSPPGRDALAKFIVRMDYIAKLVPLVELAEDLESLSDLHRLCNIMKMLILLNDTSIIEYVVTDEVILGVVGALEYDPDFPSHKANHRQYLSDDSRFKEVVPIEDPNIRKKIHYTYRLQYLKDVVLARILDDPTFGVLNSLIFFHQVDIVTHLQGNAAFLRELFGIFSPQVMDAQRKKDAVLFIQQCCSIAKSLQANARTQLYTNFISGGLFTVITFALRHQDASVRIAGTEILVALIDYDPLMMRGHIFKAINEKTKPLTDTLIELLLVETDLGVKHQMAEAIRVLLDPNANSASMETLGRSNSDFLMKMRGGPPTGPQTDSFIQSFYDESAKKLFQPLKDLEGRESMENLNIQEVTLYSHLVEMLCFFIKNHAFRSKFFILSEGLHSRVAQLMACPEKHLKLTALKYFRNCIGLQDEFHNRQITTNRLFDPILKILFDTMPRDNLLNSVCLEFFEFIKRENVKACVTHIVEEYRTQLENITYVDTFQGLISKYEQYKEQSFPTQDADQSFTSQETDTPNRGIINGGQRWQGLKDTDAEEEAYFNGSDNEDEEDENRIPDVKPAANGASPVRPLVNYPDDEEDAMETLPQRTPAKESQPAAEPSDSPQREQTPVPQAPPPERLAEKRRREEDEEDELGKLSTLTKRRSSSVSSAGSTASSNASNSSNILRRKKSINSGKDGPPKKIAISLSMKGATNHDSAE
ncbi:hypothetical protein W97_07583 [Coniosporium apollinis CBS 100218]|uniref:Uncharacterized protein n=1 Tax=Coniosporium apollinis (strain CBS 100218) TaxID=1168221 RepID=R7Z2A2_CONA1|nr:uncharacterized protein W97_07583 [Coniosporium apollinis CBS 100218]EON68325.1 hypothetical protein W97_07583 [Coniosporium apollinis CBS 100218]